MIVAIIGTILKTLLVVVLIAGMIMALMAINYAVVSKTHRSSIASPENPEEELRREVEQSDGVIGRRSVFHDFLVREHYSKSRLSTLRREHKHVG